MARLEILQALSAIMTADFPRVYIYPDEYPTMPHVPDFPFFIIQEYAGQPNDGHQLASRLVVRKWDINVYGYYAWTAVPPPSMYDAEWKIRAMADRDKLCTLLNEHPSLSNTILNMGDEGDAVYREYIATGLPWNKNRKTDIHSCDGFVFEITVLSKQ